MLPEFVLEIKLWQDKPGNTSKLEQGGIIEHFLGVLGAPLKTMREEMRGLKKSKYHFDDWPNNERLQKMTSVPEVSVKIYAEKDGG